MNEVKHLQCLEELDQMIRIFLLGRSLNVHQAMPAKQNQEEI